MDENRPVHEVQLLQESAEVMKRGSPQVQVLRRAQLNMPAGDVVVETGRHGLRRTGQERPGGRLQNTETLIGQVPQQQISTSGDGRQLRLQVTHHV
jgi:hypothetical protein